MILIHSTREVKFMFPLDWQVGLGLVEGGCVEGLINRSVALDYQEGKPLKIAKCMLHDCPSKWERLPMAILRARNFETQFMVC